MSINNYSIVLRSSEQVIYERRVPRLPPLILTSPFQFNVKGGIIDIIVYVVYISDLSCLRDIRLIFLKGSKSLIFISHDMSLLG